VFKAQEMHTLPHELIDTGRAAGGAIHPVSSLQQVIDFSQINSGVWRHSVCCQLP